ncbi:hypothetical protein Q7A53_05975 [Halobacillus rhizosphaerae]|uniref:hypothetical protein n=1 Tax=Halobacillus rhizosphaerae TaxID=3064889 RepID=UPI00398B04FF
MEIINFSDFLSKNNEKNGKIQKKHVILFSLTYILILVTTIMILRESSNPFEINDAFLNL